VSRLRKKYPLISQIPDQLYLWLAILIFGASSAITRELTQIGTQHLIDGQNPISLCNVLFVGNLCALIVLILVYGKQWNPSNLRKITKNDWLALVVVAILSGAIAPALIFQALAIAPVNNIVLIGRLEPPLTIGLSVWLLKERVNHWQILGAFAGCVGVVLTIVLQSSEMVSTNTTGIKLGAGELMTAIAAIISVAATFMSKVYLSSIPLGISNIVRTTLGTIIFFVVAMVLYGSDHFINAFSPFLWKWMLVYGAVIVVLGQSLWLKGLRTATVTTASLAGSFTPIVGILAAYLILGEAPNLAQYIGSSFILLGIILGQIGIHIQNSRKSNLWRTDSLHIMQEIESSLGFKGM